MPQSNWRHCRKCQGLFFAGLATTGACPAGGGHDYSQTPIPNYTLQDNSLGTPGQSNWRWCNKCQGLFFAGNFTTGTCPAGGGHDYTGSLNYTLNNFSLLGGDNNWRWCAKCQGLFTIAFVLVSPCPAGGTHDASGSGTYTLPVSY